MLTATGQPDGEPYIYTSLHLVRASAHAALCASDVMNGQSRLYISQRPGLASIGAGLRERGASAGQVIGRNHNLDAPESCVSKLDIDVGLSELPGQLAEGAGPILDIHHEHLALVGDPHPGTLERLPAPGHGLVVKEQVDDAPALAGERSKTANADS